MPPDPQSTLKSSPVVHCTPRRVIPAGRGLCRSRCAVPRRPRFSTPPAPHHSPLASPVPPFPCSPPPPHPPQAPAAHETEPVLFTSFPTSSARGTSNGSGWQLKSLPPSLWLVNSALQRSIGSLTTASPTSPSRQKHRSASLRRPHVRKILQFCFPIVRFCMCSMYCPF
jgi:hypothetical protein